MYMYSTITWQFKPPINTDLTCNRNKRLVCVPIQLLQNFLHEQTRPHQPADQVPQNKSLEDSTNEFTNNLCVFKEFKV